MRSAQQVQNPICIAQADRVRMVDTASRLERALSHASFSRESDWGTRISELLTATQAALRETRKTANSKGSLMEELASQFPHLLARVNRLRSEYIALQQQMETLQEKISAQPATVPQEVEWIREELAGLLTQLRRIQSQETELIFEAYDVDIGVGD
jgi:chromosome segregation ATPase